MDQFVFVAGLQDALGNFFQCDIGVEAADIEQAKQKVAALVQAQGKTISSLWLKEHFRHPICATCGKAIMLPEHGCQACGALPV